MKRRVMVLVEVDVDGAVEKQEAIDGATTHVSQSLASTRANAYPGHLNERVKLHTVDVRGLDEFFSNLGSTEKKLLVETIIVVEGDADCFPIEMLCQDSCVPATKEDSDTICASEQQRPSYGERARVTLRRFSPDGSPSNWNSLMRDRFGVLCGKRLLAEDVPHGSWQLVADSATDACVPRTAHQATRAHCCNGFGYSASGDGSEVSCDLHPRNWRGKLK